MTLLVALALASIASLASAQSTSGSTASSAEVSIASRTGRVISRQAAPRRGGITVGTTVRSRATPTRSSRTSLPANRSGGAEGVHWKYTNNPNDPACLEDWKYYAFVQGRTTFERDTRRWCALPVYRSGGRKGYQWSLCLCREE